jgi:hypothetical protein
MSMRVVVDDDAWRQTAMACLAMRLTNWEATWLWCLLWGEIDISDRQRAVLAAIEKAAFGPWDDHVVVCMGFDPPFPDIGRRYVPGIGTATGLLRGGRSAAPGFIPFGRLNAAQRRIIRRWCETHRPDWAGRC